MKIRYLNSTPRYIAACSLRPCRQVSDVIKKHLNKRLQDCTFISKAWERHSWCHISINQNMNQQQTGAFNIKTVVIARSSINYNLRGKTWSNSEKLVFGDSICPISAFKIIVNWATTCIFAPGYLLHIVFGDTIYR